MNIKKEDLRNIYCSRSKHFKVFRGKAYELLTFEDREHLMCHHSEIYPSNPLALWDIPFLQNNQKATLVPSRTMKMPIGPSWPEPSPHSPLFHAQLCFTASSSTQLWFVLSIINSSTVVKTKNRQIWSYLVWWLHHMYVGWKRDYFLFLSLSLCLYLCLYFVARCPFLTSITSTTNSSRCFQDSLSLFLYFSLSLCPYLHLSVRLYLSLSSLWMPIFDPNHPQQQSNQAASKPLCLCLCICLCLCVHICIILCLPSVAGCPF